MSKRLADTDKYKKSFIRGLPGPYKLLWDYICLDCNHAGIWEVDFEVAQLKLGADMPVNDQEALKQFNKGEERILVLNGAGSPTPEQIEWQHALIGKGYKAVIMPSGLTYLEGFRWLQNLVEEYLTQ